MATMIDWEIIKSADIDRVGGDEGYAEDLFLMLSDAEFNVKDEESSRIMKNDPILLQRLFDIYKQVMNVKHVQYTAVCEEMEDAIEDAAKRKESEMEYEMEKLQQELHQYQKQDGTTDRYVHEELRNANEANEVFRKEIEELESRLFKQQNSYDRMNTDMQGLEVRYQATKKELDQAHSDIKEYQRQFATKRDMRAPKERMEVVREEMVKKNREISEYLDEIKNLQVANDQLQDDLGNAKTELEQATEDMNSMTNDYSRLKNVLEDTEKVLEDMRKERDVLRSQLQDMEIQMQLKSDGDDKIMGALNEKVAEWKGIMVSKEAEIKSKQQEINELQKQIQASRLDSDSNAMMKLAESNASKDEQIKKLKEKLQLATKDYQDVTSQINSLKDKNKDGAASVYQQKKIQKLNATIEEDQMKIARERIRVEEAEKDVIDKDSQIAELINKIIQYEQGQYGLAEAVTELKDSRAQIRVRDSHIEELTQEVNKLHIEINDLGLENEEMRERLGLGSRQELDLVAIRKKKAIKEEQTVALNSVLQREVEKLEEERVQLKKALRKQALDRGEKAVELGLTAKDLEPEDDLSDIVSLRSKSRSPGPKEISVKRQLPRQDGADQDQDYLVQQIKKYEQEVKELKEENSHFEIGLREINGVLREGVGPSSTIQVPAMDKLIAIIEQRNATGQYDTNLHLKGEIQFLFGRNEELRSELRNAHMEITNVISELDKRGERIVDQENEINILREASEKVHKLNPLPLPDGIAPTSKEIIACLNEYMIQILQELSNKEELCSQMQYALEELRRNYSVAKHQQSILYKEHFELKEVSDKEKKQFEEDRNELLLQKSQDVVRIQEFDRFIVNIETIDDQPKKLLAELTRKITVLRVNEKSLTRRYTIIQEVEKNLRKENGKLRRDALDMEAAVTTKMGNLERHKEMSCYKITSLQKQLEDTVPAFELEMANKQFNELTAKYRDILQRENNLVGRSNVVDELQIKCKVFG